MLEITDNTINAAQDFKNLKSVEKMKLNKWHFSFYYTVWVLFVMLLLFLFLPWTQNVQASGSLTSLSPENRPQTLPSAIAGKIENWYINEGQLVKKGDTIVHISEIKSEYLDPLLVQRVGEQVAAKELSIGAYQSKFAALEDQVTAMERERVNKIDQIGNKILSLQLKIVSDSISIAQANNDLLIAQRQLEGIQPLYEKGIEPLTKFEERRLKLVDAQTKWVKANNNFSITQNDLQQLRIELPLVNNEFANKIAKARSDQFSAQSDQFNALGSVSKLKIDSASYAQRAKFYFVLAPQDGYIVKAIAAGIGEIIKEGDPIVTILPAFPDLAVEMYVQPLDLPLLKIDHSVRFMFDGWPAFFFSGWPGLSMGTFSGKVVVIDRNISSNGKFRVLVKPDPNDVPWPEALRMGGGAKGIAMLNNVPIWYELWRLFNGFPADMYKDETKLSETKLKETQVPYKK